LAFVRTLNTIQAEFERTDRGPTLGQNLCSALRMSRNADIRNAARRLNAAHFDTLVRGWARITPPMRPNHEVAPAMAREIAGCRERALLLGVTPEFVDLAHEMVALDINSAMVGAIWPGDTAARRAVVGDWLRAPFVPQSFSCCLGDGSFTVLRYPEEVTLLFVEMARVLRPGGKVVSRLFACPDRAETATEFRDAALAGAIRSFHAFKWRLGMVLASEDFGYNVPVLAMLGEFNRLFPDRDRLARAAGWDRALVDDIDNYKGMPTIFSFPPCHRVAATAAASFVNIRFVPSGTYEMAERCPLMVMERP
jgi:SAM-dependent methyltransferase